MSVDKDNTIQNSKILKRSVNELGLGKKLLVTHWKLSNDSKYNLQDAAIVETTKKVREIDGVRVRWSRVTSRVVQGNKKFSSETILGTIKVTSSEKVSDATKFVQSSSHKKPIPQRGSLRQTKCSNLLGKLQTRVWHAFQAQIERRLSLTLPCVGLITCRGTNSPSWGIPVITRRRLCVVRKYSVIVV